MRFKFQDVRQWHYWFAWYPVTVGDQVVWLETIERRGEPMLGLMDIHVVWEYR